MSKFNSRLVVTFLAGSLVTALGCSKSGSLSPSSPSAVAVLPSGFQESSVQLSSMAGNNTPGAPHVPGGPRGPRVAGEGTVASLSGTCPDVTLVVRGVRVTANNDTAYEIGACENLRPGSKVVVEGDFETDGSVAAVSITITDQPGGHPVAGEGTVGSLRGSCPFLTMVVHGYPVMTTEDTTFANEDDETSDDVCAAIRSGSRIRVSGEIHGNSVLADTVTLLPAVP